jgi:RimJ/RimL family protein N-acetyltransferase
MQLKKYGVTLDRLTDADLEQVRLWRNMDHVRSQMQFQEIITPEQHSMWFKKLDQTTNFYFVISAGSMRVGLVNLKDIDWERETAEAGIFIGEQKLLSTHISLAATVLIMEFAFYDQGLKKLRAKISAKNENAIRFNLSLGYEPTAAPGIEDFFYYEVTPAKFEAATQQMKQTLLRL